MLGSEWRGGRKKKKGDGDLSDLPHLVNYVARIIHGKLEKGEERVFLYAVLKAQVQHTLTVAHRHILPFICQICCMCVSLSSVTLIGIIINKACSRGTHEHAHTWLRGRP